MGRIAVTTPSYPLSEQLPPYPEVAILAKVLDQLSLSTGLHLDGYCVPHDDIAAPDLLLCNCYSLPSGSCKNLAQYVTNPAQSMESSGQPDRDGSRVPLAHPPLSRPHWVAALDGYRNGDSALYIAKELAHGGLAGLVSNLPLEVACSPLGSAPRQGSAPSRTLTDCSLSGGGVNNWFLKQVYRNKFCKPPPPGVGVIITNIRRMRPPLPDETLVDLEMDLSRSFRNNLMDLGQVKFIGVWWDSLVYLTPVFSFGIGAAMVNPQWMSDGQVRCFRSRLYVGLRMGRIISPLELSLSFLWFPDGVGSAKNISPSCLSRWDSAERRATFPSTLVRADTSKAAEVQVSPDLFKLNFRRSTSNFHC